MLSLERTEGTFIDPAEKTEYHKINKIISRRQFTATPSAAAGNAVTGIVGTGVVDAGAAVASGVAAGTAGTGLSVSIGIIAVGAAILVVFAILLIKTGKAAARQPETYYPSNGPAPSSFGNSQDDLMAQMEASRMANEQYGSMDDTGYKPAHAAPTGTVDLGKSSSASGMDGLDTSYFNNSGDVSSIGNYLDDNK